MKDDAASKLVRLGDVLTLKRGYDLPAATRRPGAVPIVSSSGITGFHDTPKVKGPGVVTGRYGTLGEVFYISSDFWPLNTSLYVRDFKGNDPRFCGYLLSTLQLGAGSSASAVPGVNRNHLHEILVRHPPITLQRHIAGILAAYDDFIDVNTRRMTILEEMVRRLFDEWFVKFRFPGYEITNFVETKLGVLPANWRQIDLAGVADVNRDALSPSTAPETIHYIDISCVSPGSVNEIRTLRFADAPGRARRRVQRGDVIWSMVRPNRRSYALMLRVEPNTVASTGFAVLSAKTVPWSYLYMTVTTDRFVDYLEGRTRGSAYPAVSGSDFEHAKLHAPPGRLLDEFHRYVGPQLELAAALRRQNHNLRTARDLLLPKLISGEIDLARAERGLEAAADQAAAE